MTYHCADTGLGARTHVETMGIGRGPATLEQLVHKFSTSPPLIQGDERPAKPRADGLVSQSSGWTIDGEYIDKKNTSDALKERYRGVPGLDGDL